MLTIKNLTKSHAGRTLFRETEMTINWGERVALVGPNGAGKSTLFRMILGEDTPDEGSISMDEYAIVGYLPQEASEPKDETVLEIALGITPEMEQAIHTIRTAENANKTDTPEYAEAIDTFNAANGYQLEPKAKKILKGLAFRESDFHRPAREMSGGWIMRAYLAKLLVLEPDLLMLDEPTNHLDLLSLLWLQRYLKNYPGAILMISHDRDFMDELGESVYDIDNEELVEYRGNYSDFLQQKDVRFEQLQAAYRNQQKEIAHIQEFIDRFRSINSKAGQVQSRIKQLEKIVPIEVDEEDNSALRLKFPPAMRSGNYPVICEDVRKAYGEHVVFDHVTLTINRGEKVAFVGKNGEGKSTLVKCIMGEIPFDGKLTIGHNVQIGYFAQNQAQLLDENLTVFDTIDRVATGDVRLKIRDILGAFMFGGEASDKKVKVLSGGERSRLAMIKLLLEPVNFLILDEPTNHLDMRSKDVLKDAIRDFDGTVIVVSHDREFLDGLVTKVYEFGGGQVREHLGGIYDFLQKKKIDSLQQLAAPTLSASPTATKTEEAPVSEAKLSYEAQKELAKKIRKVEKQVADCEARIEKLEADIAALETRMATPEGASDMSLYEQHTALKKELDTAVEEWENASMELDELKEQTN